MIVLDTNVISELTRRSPEPAVVQWLDRQPRASVWITSVTLFEVRFGLQVMEDGKRRTALVHAVDAFLEAIEHRIVPFDSAAAREAADLMAARHRVGHPVELRDTIIAGIVLANHATLATRNTGHFAGLRTLLVNPWNVRSGPQP